MGGDVYVEQGMSILVLSGCHRQAVETMGVGGVYVEQGMSISIEWVSQASCRDHGGRGCLCRAGREY